MIESPIDTHERHNMSDAPAYTTPKALSEELGVDPKVLRSFLRKTFTRPVEAKNTTWLLDEDCVAATKEHYASLAAKKLTEDVANLTS